jgi:HPt (histidine-containing phosphotransfer) domain-containing protein
MSPFLIPIVGILAGTLMALGFPLVRAYARKLELEGQQPRVPQEVADRLARMEHAIDAVAVEVERIAEAQRFTTRLLTERAESQASLTAGVQETSHAR